MKGLIAASCQQQVSKPAPLAWTTEAMYVPFRDADKDIIAGTGAPKSSRFRINASG